MQGPGRGGRLSHRFAPERSQPRDPRLPRGQKSPSRPTIKEGRAPCTRRSLALVVLVLAGARPGRSRRRPDEERGQASGSRGSERLPAAIGQREDQARDLPDLRQRPFPTGQPERPVRPRADAAPAQLHPLERHVRPERPHGADLTHGERDPDQPHRDVLRSPRSAGLELVPLLQDRRLDRVVLVLQVLDRPRRRHRHAARGPAPEHGERGQRHAEERSGAVGPVHPRRLRLRVRPPSRTSCSRTRPPARTAT